MCCMVSCCVVWVDAVCIAYALVLDGDLHDVQHKVVQAWQPKEAAVVRCSATADALCSANPCRVVPLAVAGWWVPIHSTLLQTHLNIVVFWCICIQLNTLRSIQCIACLATTAAAAEGLAGGLCFCVYHAILFLAALSHAWCANMCCIQTKDACTYRPSLRAFSS